MGGLVSTALIGSPCGGPKSPPFEPPVVAGACGDSRGGLSRSPVAAIATGERDDAGEQQSGDGALHAIPLEM